MFTNVAYVDFQPATLAGKIVAAILEMSGIGSIGLFTASLAKAIAESAGRTTATGFDVKAFCASTLYAVFNAAALVQAGVFSRVAVVAGGSLAKLGMTVR